MEKHFELRNQAINKLRIADHMLTMTYPLLKDPRLLLSVAENISLSLSYCVDAVVYREYFFKRIPVFSESTDSRFDVFDRECAPRFNINHDNIVFIKDMKSIVIEHKKSPVEFARKTDYVICDMEYNCKKLTPDDLKNHINKTKLFIQEITNILGKG